VCDYFLQDPQLDIEQHQYKDLKFEVKHKTKLYSIDSSSWYNNAKVKKYELVVKQLNSPKIIIIARGSNILKLKI
jgi:hypothetical protein